MLEKYARLKEDIEGACDTSMPERLREQHRDAALEAVALLEAFAPVIAVKDEMVLRAGERGKFRVQDPARSVEVFGEGEIVTTRRELNKDETMDNITNAIKWDRRPMVACTMDVRIVFLRATIKQI